MRKAFDEPTCWGDDSRITIGNNVNLVNTLFNTVSGDIVIGDWTIFGHNCMVITGTHDVSKQALERQQYVKEGRDIYIGRGVWIGSGAIILGPCTIMDHAVIGAGSVVLPGVYNSGFLFAGNPATTKKKVIE
jgi:acetyltransferase-like isoleucine patch superfamily enzyme